MGALKGLYLFIRWKLVLLMLAVGGIFSLASASVLAKQMDFAEKAMTVEAAVVEAETSCTLLWYTRVFFRKYPKVGDRMDCDQARRVQAEQRETIDYEVLVNTKLKIAYTGPDGRRYSDWTKISTYQGRDLELGSRFKILVDPLDPSVVEEVRGTGYLLATFAFCVVMSLIALLGLIGTFSSLPFEQRIRRKIEAIDQRSSY